MKISITLPSIYPQALWRTLENIRDATVNEVEILVVTPNIEPHAPAMRPGQEVVWIREKERRGCAAAHDTAARAATGDFLFAFTDDFLLADRWDETAIADFTEREKLHDGGYVLGLRYDDLNLVGTVFGIYYANFPMMRRSDFSKFGWITPGYQKGFGDIDFSMRVWRGGGACEFSTDILLIRTADDLRKGADVATTEDMAVFLSRWAPIFGQGWETQSLRKFNIDVIPEKMPAHLLRGGRTIFHNDPEFPELVKNASAPHLVESVGAWNIIWFRGAAYAVPQAAGAVDLTNDDDLARVFKVGGASFETIPEARSYALQAKAPPESELIETIGTRNIVKSNGGYYVVPQAIGPVDLALEADRARPEIRFCLSIEEARRLCAAPDRNATVFARMGNYFKGVRRHKRQ